MNCSLVEVGEILGQMAHKLAFFRRNQNILHIPKNKYYFLNA